MTEVMFVTVATEFAIHIIVAVVSVILNGICLVRSVDKDGGRVLKRDISSVSIHDVAGVVLLHVDVAELHLSQVNCISLSKLAPDRSQILAHSASGSDKGHNPNVLIVSHQSVLELIV